MGLCSPLFFCLTLICSMIYIIFFILPSALNWNDINFQLHYQVGWMVTCLVYWFWIFALFFLCTEKKEKRKMLPVQVLMIGLNVWKYSYVLFDAREHPLFLKKIDLTHTLNALYKHTHRIARHRIESSMKRQMEKIASFTLWIWIKSSTRSAFAKWSISILPCHSKSNLYSKPKYSIFVDGNNWINRRSR